MSYDLAGNLYTASDSAASFTFGYDLANRIDRVTNIYTSGPSLAMTYSYDGYGNRSGVSGASGGINYTHDAAGRLTSATLIGGSSTATATLSHDNTDRLTGISRDEGGSATISTSTSYDNANRVTGISHTSSVAGSLAGFTYSYDAASRITAYTGPEGTLAYSYDNTNQLTGVSNARTESYSYDANGNRTMTGYTTGTGNRLTSDGTYNYTYDNEGNLLAKTTISSGAVTDYTWD